MQNVPPDKKLDELLARTIRAHRFDRIEALLVILLAAGILVWLIVWGPAL